MAGPGRRQLLQPDLDPRRTPTYIADSAVDLRWSPNGQNLLAGALITANLAIPPTWSPDGTVVEFTSAGGNSVAAQPFWGTDLVDSDFAIVENNVVVADPNHAIYATTEGGLSFDPAGRVIYFAGEPGDGTGYSVYAVSVDGTSSQRLTRGFNIEVAPAICP